jgi:DNA-binding NarL/FixJ family response regulator
VSFNDVVDAVATRRTALLVDPHPLWLEAVEEVVQRADYDVVAKATSFAEALALAKQHAPSLAIGETDLEGRSGPAIWELRERFPEVQVIVLSLANEPDRIAAALRAGALAYVLKKAHPDDLAAVVRQALKHSIYLPPDRLGGPAEIPREDGASLLTPRELEILRLVAEGHSNAALAKMLWVTEQTVKFHLSNIYRKLDVSNRTEASRWAQVNGVLAPADQRIVVA